ncbi:sucrose-6-phosphate hydrolase [Pseudaeromonas sharmana]|uniref:Sucrose-6-phosphate hydrolase n=1 Tax=Pseudaeromonas sharmana TaxID=328412 RepID=A0ABV8CQA6_9GAMM
MSEARLLNLLARSLLAGQARAAQDPYRPVWHLAPSVGLLNDPNGFIQHKGRYHLCYQWNPFSCEHGAKFWGHWSSDDLLHWQHEPVALVPAEQYERNGCYSGCAVVKDDELTLIYTGNVKYPDGNRTAFQCLAVAEADGTFRKLGPVLPLPAGYTGHVRDPKVWFEQECWWMVLAAQDLQRQGKILLLRSADLHHWQLLGELAGSQLNGLRDFGYMWECPDLFRLQNQAILLCCPQGLPHEAERYRNRFQAGYFIGDLDLPQASFRHAAFQELDLGFEFYAPQTTCADDGRRLLFAWMGVPEQDEADHPTRAYGWIHCMTCPRELTLEDGQLRQRPARELQQLRGAGQQWQGSATAAPCWPCASAELLIQPQGAFALTLAEGYCLSWDGQRLTLTRPSLQTGQPESRSWRGHLQQLTLLFDHSSLEIFINDGEAVMSSRLFTAQPACSQFQGDTTLHLRYWPLTGGVLE